ncbi:MAG: hypothetical protein QM723_09620 [Myxococcaceae bacterium]
MQEYLLRVSKSAKADILKYLALNSAPTYVRVSTLAPLSNWGYPAGAEAQILRVLDHGIIMGQAGDQDEAPHDFVPWQNIAYISDGTGFAKEMGTEK